MIHSNFVGMFFGLSLSSIKTVALDILEDMVVATETQRMVSVMVKTGGEGEVRLLTRADATVAMGEYEDNVENEGEGKREVELLTRLTRHLYRTYVRGSARRMIRARLIIDIDSWAHEPPSEVEAGFQPRLMGFGAQHMPPEKKRA